MASDGDYRIKEFTASAFLRYAAGYVDKLQESSEYVADELGRLARGPGNFAIADELLRLARVAKGEESPDGH